MDYCRFSGHRLCDGIHERFLQTACFSGWPYSRPAYSPCPFCNCRRAACRGSGKFGYFCSDLVFLLDLDTGSVCSFHSRFTPHQDGCRFVNRLSGAFMGLVKYAFFISLAIHFIEFADSKDFLIHETAKQRSLLYYPIASFSDVFNPVVKEAVNDLIETTDFN